MPTFDASEAHRHIKPEQMDGFKKALADADADGKEVYEVIIASGVPLVYSIRDKA